MFRSIFFLLAVCLYGHIAAQNISDVVYLNSPVLLGTPRFTAAAGAFTALGNDFSGMQVNPAGLAVFRHDEFGISMGFGSNTISSTYYGRNQSESDNSFLLSNIGYTKKFFTDDPDVTWNIAIAYNRNNDLNSSSKVFGINPTSSILQSWINNANGTPPTDLFNSGLIYEALAYEAFLIDPDVDNNYSTQAQIETTEQYWAEDITGHFDELSFAVALDQNSKLYYGASINIPFYKYNSAYYYTESGYGGDSIKGMEWVEEFSNRGAGFNIKLGAIYRPIPNLRIGASIFTPTWLGITQTYSTTVNSIFNNSPDYSAKFEQGSSFKYGMRNAPQANLGLAYVFDKNGFLSVDYAFIPTKWSGTSTNELNYLNDEINGFLQNQHNVRVGAEIRFSSIFFRGGYSWLSNPYNIEGQDATQNTYSLGIGYRSNKITFDICYAIQNHNQTYFPYDSSLVNGAQQTITRKPFIASVSFKL